MDIQTFNFAVNLMQVIIWQYDQSPALKSIITYMNTWFVANQTQFWTDWYNNVFNLLTANEFGLAVWAIILNVPFTENLFPRNPQPFGFGPIGNGYFSFGYSTFSDGGYPSLTNSEKRFILLLRYFQLITRGAIPEINAFLKFLIPFISTTGQIYVLDNLNMTITYVFTFNPGDRILTIIDHYDLLPRPAGVEAIIQLPT